MKITQQRLPSHLKPRVPFCAAHFAQDRLSTAYHSDQQSQEIRTVRHSPFDVTAGFVSAIVLARKLCKRRASGRVAISMPRSRYSCQQCSPDATKRKWAPSFDGSQQFPAKLYQFPSRSAHWVRDGAGAELYLPSGAPCAFCLLPHKALVNTLGSKTFF